MPDDGQSISTVVALGGLLKRIGVVDPSGFKSSFVDRLIVQKTIYLMQEFGLFIGYRFNWYVHGPYSPGLAGDAYALCGTYDAVPWVQFVKREDEERFKQFLVFIGARAHDHDWLEKIGSIHFLSKMYPSMSREAIRQRVGAKGLSLTRDELDTIVRELREFGLFPEGR